MSETLIYAVVSVGVLALLFGAVLGFAARRFAVKTDPAVEKVLNSLPGINCGSCGFPGCAIFAERAVADKDSYVGCPVAGAEGSAEIAKHLGVDTSPSERKVAFVKCWGTDNNTMRNYIYDGPRSCVAASQLAAGGNKACAYSCIGHGSCLNICPFGAVDIMDSVAVINPDKCAACGKCVAVCPKKLIELVPAQSAVRVLCNSRDKGKTVRINCRAGCLGCGICQKQCKEGAISLQNNLAVIDYDKCTQCRECVNKCPAKVIRVIQ